MFSQQRTLTVRGLRAAQDMVSCDRHRCLYVADSGRDAVHRVCSDGASCVWPLNDKPAGLSVTRFSGSEMPQSSPTLLVAFFASQMLREYLPDGKMLRQISLDSDVGK